MGPTEQIEQDLARAALEKRRRGERPTREEARALARIEKAREEELRWQFYSTIPQKHWRAMSGRQAKILREQADRYGLPFGDRTIDLPAVVRAIHDFLAANARKLAAGDDADPLLAGCASPALELYRRERAKLARIDRLKAESRLLPRALVHDALGRVASRIRRCGESLQRQFGPDALKVLDDALIDAQLEIDNLLPDPGGDDGDTNPDA